MLSPVLLLLACGSPTTEPPTDTGPPTPAVDPLELDVTSIDFGMVHADCAPTQSVRVHNPNDLAIEIDALRWTGDLEDIGSASFPELPSLAIPAGETVVLAVWIGDPDSLELQIDAELHLDTVLADAAPAPLTVRGSLSTAPIWSDTFVQAAARDTDLLFVLDDAPDLEAHVLDLIPHLDGLFDTLAQQSASAQIGVVSTDDDGLLAGPWFPNDTTAPDTLSHQLLASDFDDYDPAAWQGGPYVDAVVRALSTNRMATAPNQGLVRATSTLEVVAIADRDASDAWSWMHLVDALRSQKQSPTDVRLHLIGPDSAACPFAYTFGSLDEDDGLLAAQRTLGGLFEPICEASSTTFTRIAQQSMRLGSFQLAEADASLACSDVDVQIDGTFVPCSQRTLVNGALQIHGPAVPTPGQTITVAYPVDATCERWEQPEG